MGRVSDVTEKVVGTLQHQFGRVIEIINKQIIPKLSEIVQSIVQVAASVSEQVIDLVFVYLGKVSIFLEAHQAELNQIATTFSAIGQGTLLFKRTVESENTYTYTLISDLGRFLYKLVQQARVVAAKEWNEFYEGVKTLPIAEELKAKYEQVIS